MLRRLVKSIIFGLVLSSTAAAFEFVDFNTQHWMGFNVHICGQKSFMRGAHVQANRFLCTNKMTVYQHGGRKVIGEQMIVASRRLVSNQGYQSHGMAACPPGKAMVGLHAGKNQLVCGSMVGLGKRYALEVSIDSNTVEQEGGVTMHACPVGSVMVGIHISKNLFLCGHLEQDPFYKEKDW